MIRIIRRYLLPAAAAALAVSAAGQQLAGDWRGDSTCVGKRPACHDEKVVYHIVKSPHKQGFWSVSADKIVDGKAISMGALEFQYDQSTRTLTCEYAQGVWRLKVDNLKMEGTLTLTDKSVARHVSLKKEE